MTVEEKLLVSFPNVTNEIKDYVLSILHENAADFGSAHDVYDAVGHILLNVSEEYNDRDVMGFCADLAKLLISPRSNNDIRPNNDGSRKLLENPTFLHNQRENDFNFDEPAGIMTAQSRPVSANPADSKKLEKIEQKLKQKQEKRAAAIPNTPSTSILNNCQPTVNQAISKKDAKMDANFSDIKLENFDICFGDRKLLLEANLTLVFGRRYGLVGRNGLGKTTLLKMISSGNLHIPAKISVLHVEQEVDGDETEVLQSVLECDQQRHALLTQEREIQHKLQQHDQQQQCSEIEQRELAAKLTEIYEQLQHMEADKAPARAACILNGLGFDSVDQKRPTKEFSGGWRMRLALARALFLQPDLLLLDEPTNMLDMKAIYWLEGYLQSWKKTLLVVSHDRNFLNEICTDIVYLRNQTLDHYTGNYDNFEKIKDEKLKNQQREYEAQKQLREHVQVFIDRFRYNANRAALVQSKIKMLEKLPELKPVEFDSDVIFNFPVCEKLHPPILQMDEIWFKYDRRENEKSAEQQQEKNSHNGDDGDPYIFRNCSLNADMESRICIVGENGAGKTTLLKLLIGDLDPCQGMRKAHRNLKIAYFTQHFVDQLVMNVNPVQLMQSKFPGLSTEQYRAALGRFGISGDLALQSVLSLSGGQKSRLAFAIICMQNPNFLILDEPTNHLDIESVEALGKAVGEFAGGVILVSHDERLIEMVCKELWVVKNRTVRRLEGGLKEYRQIIEKELAEQLGK